MKYRGRQHVEPKREYPRSERDGAVLTAQDRGGAALIPWASNLGTKLALRADVDKDEALWLARDLARGWYCSPAERQGAQLTQLIEEIVASVERGEISQDDATTVMQTVIAIDFERRFGDLISGVLGGAWAAAIDRLYTRGRDG